jgi:GDP-L-fucose synthase
MSSVAGATIYLTGGSGFLGSFVREALEARGAENIIIPRSADCDLTDARATHASLAAAKPDMVIHLAAKVGGIGANRKHPGTFFRDNMAMGLNVIEASRALDIKKVVIAGTICAYPKFAPVPFKEDDLWNGYPEETNAPYGIAKKALLVMAQAYRQEFGSNMVMVFPVNLYGPRDNFDLESSHVIPAMIRKLIEAKLAGAPEVSLWGDGSPTREFLYVKDAAEGIVMAAEKYDHEDPVNLGTGVEISMRDLAEQIRALVGYEGKLAWDPNKPNGQPRRRLDVTRAKERFGFTAQTGFEAGLRETISYYYETRITKREVASSRRLDS